MAENVCEFFVLPLETPENTKKHDVQSLENSGEQRNTICSKCVGGIFPGILHVLAVRQRSG